MHNDRNHRCNKGKNLILNKFRGMKNNKLGLASMTIGGVGLIALSIYGSFLQTKQSSGNDLNLQNLNIHITKHAKERMNCRLIDQAEIREILRTGTLNDKKTTYGNGKCDTKYALEGRSMKDQQLIRVIAAPCDDKVNIVTVIDLENEIDCE